MVPGAGESSLPSWLANVGPDGDVVFSSRIRLARNLSDFCFPHSASLQERKKIFERVNRTLNATRVINNPEVYNFCGLSLNDQNFLVEERVASPDLLQGDGDRGVACDRKRRVSVMINEEDHVRIQCLDAGERSDQIWSELDELDTVLASEMGYAFDERMGYLTTCPTNSGTGLRVSFLLHLPGVVLTRSIDQILQSASQMGISTRGFLGEHSEIVGGLFQVSNQATLGMKEKEFIRTTGDTVRKIVKLERDARDRILNEARHELEDKVSRSCGILMYARGLSVSEFLTLSSTLRLGIDTSLVTTVSSDELNGLMLSIMPAHLEKIVGEENLDEQRLEIERAKVVKKFLKGRI